MCNYEELKLVSFSIKAKPHFSVTMGLMGNFASCNMFTQPSHRRTPCSIYLFTLSIFATICLIWSVVSLLYQLDHGVSQTQSLIYCNIRLYGNHVFGQCVRSPIVYSCADRFYMTRTNVRLRSLSSVWMGTKLTVIVFVTWIVVDLHLLIFLDIRDGICGLFGLYKLFYLINQIIAVSILP